MRRPAFLFSLILLLSFFLALPQASFAQGNDLGNCVSAPSYTDFNGVSYRPDGVFARYEARNKRLILVRNHTGKPVRELEISLTASRVGNFWWSPDCHYLLGTVDHDTVIWDAFNSGRVATFANGAELRYIDWNPARDSIVLHGDHTAVLWHFTQSDPIPLTFSGDIPKPGLFGFNWFFYWQVEWDNQRNQVLIVPDYAEHGNAVVAYDQVTGQQIAYFHNAGQEGSLKFTITPDNRDVIVFTSATDSFPTDLGAITIWDRDTMQSITVDVNNVSAALATEIALSPDKRYLVLARIGTMRVWDLANLAPTIDERDPIHRYRIEPETKTVQFVSDTVVETTDFQGNTHRWDLLTGAQPN